MSERIRAGIISVGTELTEGILQDTHARFLASELTAMGFFVARGSQVPDDAALFGGELSRYLAECGLVVITGGLGPTSDDLTREIVAEAAGVPLDFMEDVWNGLLERFKGRRISDTNRRQAMAPRGFSLIPNPNGTAPGFFGQVGKSLVVSLPGPPGELRPMFARSVVPLLAERFRAVPPGEALWATALLVPESNLEEALEKCRRPGIAWGTRVEEDRIVFSLRGSSSREREAVFVDLGEALGSLRIRAGDVKPARLLTDALASGGKRLVTAESCTGGLLGKWLTDLAGSSRVYWGGFVTYSNEAKEKLLGVERRILDEHGAVSEQAVTAMAGSALVRAGVEVSIAVSGVAGPDGGTQDKPVGTVWAAVAGRGSAPKARLFSFTGSRDAIRRRTAVAAFLFSEAFLSGREFLDTYAKW